jgi:para-nitrobenzyl esterase
MLVMLATGALASPSVQTPQGLVRGSISARGVEIFAGIPFAHPPTGERRFARAELNEEHWGSLDASRVGPPCIQNPAGDPRAPGFEHAPPPSEDCLQLNVYRPASVGAVEAAPLPVMVWIFGGGLCGGYAGNPRYNGSALALEQNVIVITVSYRLGALGFLPLSDFPGEGSGGMNGMYDVVVALQVRAEATSSHPPPPTHPRDA